MTPTVKQPGCPRLRCSDHNTFTKSDRARINAAFDLISDALPFGRLWYGEPNAVANAIAYAMHYTRSAEAVIRVYDSAGNTIKTHGARGPWGRTAALLFCETLLR